MFVDSLEANAFNLFCKAFGCNYKAETAVHSKSQIYQKEIFTPAFEAVLYKTRHSNHVDCNGLQEYVSFLIQHIF